MKKTLVLAALAIAGALSASAQSNVYSLNIVGYVNVVLKGNSAYTLVANPLDNGTNTINGLSIGAALPNKSQIVVYDNATAQYTTATKGSGVWGTNLPLPVGRGFFVKNGVAGSPDVTNTFVGNVIAASPSTNTVSVPIGYSLVGSPLPIGGVLTDVGPNKLNLDAALANKSQVVVYDNSGAGVYTTATKGSGVWGTNLPISVGQGFFIKAQTAGSNWVQVLQ